MNTTPERRFNLVEEAWIPVTDVGMVSLRSIFSIPTLRALGGNPIHKIAITKFLLAVAQAAHTPEDDDEWGAMGMDGMAKRVLEYLDEKKEQFWLYGEKPFLQMPGVFNAEPKSSGSLKPDIATGNTTVLLNSQVERRLTDADMALLIITLMGFALGGKKTDNSIVLSRGYAGKSNEKGKPSSGKPGPSLGFLGYLHSFIIGTSLQQTIWLNLITKHRIAEMKQFNARLGTAPWERMPAGEDCSIARNLKNSLMGRLIPLCRFILLAEAGIHYTEGIAHPTYKEGGFDLSIAVDYSSNKPKVLWTNPEKRPWRELTSLLSFISTDQKKGYECKQLSWGIPRARSVVTGFGIWSGGLKVSSHAGEQYPSGLDDFVESEVQFDSATLGEIWFTHLKAEMSVLEEFSKILFGASMGYFKSQKADGKQQAEKATTLFWQLCERKFQTLIDACGDNQASEKTNSLRRTFANFAHKAYDMYCPNETARQLDAWAANRPNLGRFLAKKFPKQGGIWKQPQ